ncbi:MAG: dephospho-CoA kinase [Gammaproteobacteria bacterium]|nr:dephospho-CoA kinase [Gammaproteobacteria bacterium]
MPFVVGLTGGIGSGKTVVSDYFAGLGVPVIDTDVIAREVVAPGQPALTQMVQTFGEQILQEDGSLNRDVMRTLAFSDADNKRKLDAITHPAIRAACLRQIAAVTYPYCVVVVPLLVADTDFSALMQRILVVTADTQTRVERVMQRSDLTREQVMAIMQSQIDDQQRLAFADDVIRNDGSIADAQAAAENLHQQYLLFSLEAPAE